jgi:transcriptional regulator
LHWEPVHGLDNSPDPAHASIDIDRRAALASNDNLQGSLVLLVLKALEGGPMHGWGITLHIQGMSNDVLRIEEGSLYPALHRMEKSGWIRAEWGLSENNRRARFYRLTATGRKQLDAEREKWETVAQAIALVLRSKALA